MSRPLWIDSLYGSNNSNIPSIYDDNYSRIHRSNVTTTNDYQPSTLIISKDKSHEQIQPSQEKNSINDSKFNEEKSIPKPSVRRIQSNYDIIQSSTINQNNLIKKSKSLTEIYLNNQQEKQINIEKDTSVC